MVRSEIGGEKVGAHEQTNEQKNEHGLTKLFLVRPRSGASCIIMQGGFDFNFFFEKENLARNLLKYVRDRGPSGKDQGSGVARAHTYAP